MVQGFVQGDSELSDKSFDSDIDVLLSSMLLDMSSMFRVAPQLRCSAGSPKGGAEWEQVSASISSSWVFPTQKGIQLELCTQALYKNTHPFAYRSFSSL